MPIEIGELKLYALDELSEKLKITKDTLRAYLKNGKLKGKKMGTKWYVAETSIIEYFEMQG